MNEGHANKQEWFGFGPEVAVTYDWINPFNTQFPWDKKGEWKWYMGVGGSLNFGWHPMISLVDETKFFFLTSVGAAGRVGVEYTFWFPLQLSVDWRPIIGPEFVSHKSLSKSYAGIFYGGLYGISASVRYRF